MKTRVLVLGAGFGGLEFSTMLSEAFGEDIELMLIDKNDSFTFGFSKLDVMFGHASPSEVHLPYRSISRTGLKFRQETITSVDPETRRVKTSGGKYECDILAIALGADYDPGATPGLVEGGNEFYSFDGASKLRDKLASFAEGNAIIGVCSAPFKCPPAPSEAALLLHEYLTKRGSRSACEISLVMPFPTPIPPAPAASKSLLAAFAERSIKFVPDRMIKRVEPSRRQVVLSDGSIMPYDLFLGIPKHKVPQVIDGSGLVEDGWIPVDENMRTKFKDVYAFGDVAEAGVPMAGMFAEGEARVAASTVIAKLREQGMAAAYDGKASCYIEFGSGMVGRTDMDFLSGPYPKGAYLGPSATLWKEKRSEASKRIARWFGGQLGLRFK